MGSGRSPSAHNLNLCMGARRSPATLNASGLAPGIFTRQSLKLKTAINLKIVGRVVKDPDKSAADPAILAVLREWQPFQFISGHIGRLIPYPCSL